MKTFPHLRVLAFAGLSLVISLTARAQSIPFQVGWWYPTNGETFTATANIGVHARVADSNVVKTVQYFANSSSIGTVTNTGNVLVTNLSQADPFELGWSNVPAGTYSLTAVATDAAGATAVSPSITIYVTNPPPPKPVVYIASPTNNSKFLAPASLTLYARAIESGGVIAKVTFVANSNVLGVVTGSNGVVYTNVSAEPLYALAWSNVVAGTYSLTAIATDTNGNATTSAVVSISVTNPPPPPKPAVYIYSPTNNAKFTAPANVTIYARAVESGGSIATVSFLANSNILGIVSGSNAAVYTNISSEPLYAFPWTNVAAGTYALTAIATDANGNATTSAVVSISVTNPPPPPKPAVYIYSPTNNAKYTAPANVTIYARAVESGGSIATVSFLANSNILGIVSGSNAAVYTNISSEPLYAFPWTNVAAGTYALTAIATDTNGNSTTSAIVSITVTTPPPPAPFYVSFYYPTNGQIYVAPATIGLHALVTDSNVVKTVQYFANSISVGIVTNTSNVLLTNSAAGNPFFLAWSNVPAGQYSLTAVATDSAGATATSAPVNIWVLSNAPPVVTIYATDPVAVAGTNGGTWYRPTNTFTNYYAGGDTATFLVRRSGATNASLTVNYTIGGTASNGVDYACIPTNVTIAAGSNYALIVITPLNNTNATTNRYETVILTLSPSTNVPPAYEVGSPQKAGVVILENDLVPMTTPQIRNFADGSVHVSLPASDGVNYCIQWSPDLIHWQPVCTNTVVKGSAHYVDPGTSGNQAVFYRVVGAPAVPSY